MNDDNHEPGGGDGRRTAGQASSSTDVVTAEQAAEILEVVEDRIPVMIEEGLLDPIGTPDGSLRFLGVDVEAVRLQGG